MAEISTTVKKELIALSGGTCSICEASLIDKNKKYNGIFAHINGHHKKSMRYNSTLSEEEKNSFWNIIMLCASCHSSVDKDSTLYTVDYLIDIKQRHEDAVYAVLSSSVISNQTSVYGGEKTESFNKLNSFLVGNSEEPLSSDEIINITKQVNILFNLSVFQRHIFMDIVTSFFSDKKTSKYRLTLDYFMNAYPNNDVLSSLATSGLIRLDNFELTDREDRILEFDSDTWSYLKFFCDKNKIDLSELIIYRNFNLLD